MSILFGGKGMTNAQAKIGKSGAKICYVAIGDSWLIGEGASLNESWPAVLTRHLNEKRLRVELVVKPSRTGGQRKRRLLLAPYAPQELASETALEQSLSIYSTLTWRQSPRSQPGQFATKS
jgi:hypothetical protein